jgi:porin
MKPLTAIVGMFCGLVFAPLAYSAEDTKEKHPPKERWDFWNGETLTGDWGGWRTTLSDRGVEFPFLYIGEGVANLAGGLQRGGTYEGLLDVGMDVDLEKLVNLEGGLFHINGFWIHGSSPTAKFVGDLQTVSNIDAFDTVKLNELWYQHCFLEDRLSLRVGLMAADKEFISSDYGALFLNAGFGWPPPVANNFTSPGYPLSALGVRLRVDPWEPVYFQAGVYDGDPGNATLNRSGTRINLHQNDGFFSIYEAGLKLNQGKKDRGLPGTYRLGGWHHTDSFPDQRFDQGGLSLADPASSGTPVMHDGNFGIYGVADQLVYREVNSKDEELQGLGVFIKAGNAAEDRNLVSLHLSGGLNYTGLIPTRDRDQIGFAVTHVDIGENLHQFDRDTNTFNGTEEIIRDYERTLELTYCYVVTPWWSIQPDVQWVKHPGGSKALGDAWVVGVRTSINF